MKRRSFGRNAGLTVRMLFTTALLGLLYVIFGVVLFSVLNVGLAPMLVIVLALAFVQYYTSDKLALAASGARVVSREEAPALHDVVERLCAMADLPKPKIAVMDTAMPNAFATGRSQKHAAICVTTGLWERLEPRGDRRRARPRARPHREPRRADHDGRELLRDARRAADALRALRRDVRRRLRWRQRVRQQPEQLGRRSG